MTAVSFGERIRRIRRRNDLPDLENNKFLHEALNQNKHEGLLLAVKARTICLVIIGLFLIYLSPDWYVLYYEILIVAFMLIGWAQVKIGRVERSRAELFLIFLDLALMTAVLVVPNPWDPRPWSAATFHISLYFLPPLHWPIHGGHWSLLWCLQLFSG